MAIFSKGLPLTGPAGNAKNDLSRGGWNLFEHSPLPAAVLLETALEHNLAWMSRFTAERGVLLAPHVKTSMSLELAQRQIDHGAWGLTVATIWQAETLRRAGFKRLLIANEVTGTCAQEAMINWIAEDDQLDLYCLVDSCVLVAQLQSVWEHCGASRPLKVMVELGYDGGRCGCRTLHSALEVARAVGRSPGLSLAGVEGFEGLLAFDPARGKPQTGVRTLARRMCELFRQCEFEGLFEVDEPIISAGGSAYFDIVAEEIRGMSGQAVLRSGCYLTHDHGLYATNQSHILARTGTCAGLKPALEIWGHVLSVPESKLAIIGLGKRDVGFDAGLPVPIKLREGSSGRVSSLSPSYSILGLNDQHAYMAVPPDCHLVPGDAVGMGISHPCTTLDKWRCLVIVDDDYVVREITETHF